jgi:ABC-type Zn2+ transport system substrate-binding protein/surface adhesin
MLPVADDMDEELADDDDDSGDEFNLQVLDPFGPDWTGYELEDELDGLYHFDAEDIFDVEDLDGLEGTEDDDEDEEEEHNGEDEEDQDGEDDDDDDDPESATDLTHG